MNSDGIWGNIFRFSKRQESLADVLHNVPVFRDLTPKELRILEGLVHIRTYEAGEPVFLESEPGAGMYVIRSGRVDIKLKYRSEQPLLLAELQAGDFFGEMALLGDSTRSATAIARESSDLIGFFHPDLEELIELRPAIGAKIALGLAHTLAERLRFTNTQLREVWDVRGRHEAVTG
jgi:CRP-like cAMP-binding protein